MKRYKYQALVSLLPDDDGAPPALPTATSRMVIKAEHRARVGARRDHPAGLRLTGSAGSLRRPVARGMTGAGSARRPAARGMTVAGSPWQPAALGRIAFGAEINDYLS